MGTTNLSDRISLGKAIIVRLDAMGEPAGVKAAAKAFRAAHAAFTGAATRTTNATEASRTALAAVAAADKQLDGAVDMLVLALITAGVTQRQRPLAGLSKFSPSEICALGYAHEVAEVGNLVAAVKKKTVPAAVTKAASECTRRAGVVQKAMDALAKPDVTHARVIGARNALIPDWDKALKELKRQASAAYDAADYQALFAPADAVIADETGKKAKGKTTKAKKPKPTPPPEPPEPPQAKSTEASEDEDDDDAADESVANAAPKAEAKAAPTPPRRGVKPR